MLLHVQCFFFCTCYYLIKISFFFLVILLIIFKNLWVEETECWINLEFKNIQKSNTFKSVDILEKYSSVVLIYYIRGLFCYLPWRLVYLN